MANKIQVKRGLKASLPLLNAGEPALCTDTKQIYVGDGTANIELANKAEVDSAIGQLALQKSENKVTVFNADGSITETIKNGVTVLRTKTTTFPSTTQIVETTVENGVTTTKTTTFNADGTIKEEVV